MKKYVLLQASILGLVLGVAGLVIAKYMLANYAFSQAQTHRSHVVRYAGLFLILADLISIVLHIVRAAKTSATSKS